MSKTVTINQDKLLMLKEVVASNELVSHIPFLYHATPSCYVDSIKEFGLGGKILRRSNCRNASLIVTRKGTAGKKKAAAQRYHFAVGHAIIVVILA